MKQFDIKEFNKMCAAFLGYVNLTPDDPDFDFYEHPTEPVKLGEHIRKTLEPMSMLFHTDWNWIMTVVEKINNPTNGIMVSIHSNSCLITDYGTRGKWNLNRSANIVRVVDASSRKEAVVQAIWEFLNWYKTQTP